MQRITDLRVSAEAQAGKLRRQPLTIIPILPQGSQGLRSALAFLRHIVSFLVLGESEDSERENGQLTKQIISLEGQNPLLEYIFVDMPESANQAKVNRLTQSLADTIRSHPDYSIDYSFTGIMESRTMWQTLWSLPRFVSDATLNIPPSFRPSWHGEQGIMSFFNSEYGWPSNLPAFFRLAYNPAPNSTIYCMNDLRTVQVYDNTTTQQPQQPQPSVNYILIAIFKHSTHHSPFEMLRLYDKSDESYDPNATTQGEPSGVMRVSGATEIPTDGCEYLLYYGKLSTARYFSKLDEEGGRCNIPLLSIEQGGDETMFGSGLGVSSPSFAPITPSSLPRRQQQRVKVIYTQTPCPPNLTSTSHHASALSITGGNATNETVVDALVRQLAKWEFNSPLHD